MILMLIAMGFSFFHETPNRYDIAGIVLAIASIALLSRFGCLIGGKLRAHLFHHSESVHKNSRFLDLAVLQAVDHHPPNHDGFSRRWDP